MITRAASALRHSLTQTTTVNSESYHMESTKPSAILQVYQILTREHRATTHLYEKLINAHGRPAKTKTLPPIDPFNP